MFLGQKVSRLPEKDEKIQTVAVQGTQNILDAITDKCKIIFPSTHVVFEGIEDVEKNIKENEATKPILSYSTSKAINEKQLKNSGKNFIILRLVLYTAILQILHENRYHAKFILKNISSKWNFKIVCWRKTN